ncbi:hypothetical protein RclHR1_04250004 [Rhizophagus clarus]|uniref:Uncharacterized protein n=1 Tax=Rhizophagus clarus TaxID=94130 RepID=A0A2Z6RFX3_9GLOM|nr:hypothetical protein RclHR1_04250004 [Rhizophagus clarus]GES89416.1 hypothetical protein GLOIN_2v1866931 [Rhizophagus clarus]
MEQSLLIISGPNDGNNKFGLGTNIKPEVLFYDDDDDPSESYTGWDYKKDFGEDAWKKLYQDREAHQCFILLRLFTMHLSNISDQAKNGLFITFSRSNSFGVLEHNALLDALAHPVKGLNLFEYYELGFDLINNAKIQ